MAAVNYPGQSGAQKQSFIKRSVAVPIVLFFVFFIALYFFGICTYGGMKYATSDYYRIMIHKFEVSASHEEAVAAAKHEIFIIRVLVAFSVVAVISSVVGIVMCIKSLIKRIKLKKQLKDAN